MTTMDRFEAGLPDLFADLGRTDASQVVADVLAATAGARQRPRLLARLASTLDRSDPRPLVRTVPTPLRVGLALILLLLTIAVAAVIVGGPRPISTLRTTLTPAGTIPRAFGTRIALALPDGRLVVAGGGDGAIAIVFDPRSGRAINIGTNLPSVQLEGAARLSDGRIFLLGWQNTDVAADGRSFAWLLDPAMDRVAAPVPTLQTRFEASVIGLPDGSVFVAAGQANPESTTTYASSERFDPSRNAFSVAPALDSPRSGQMAVALAGGDILFVGGYDDRPASTGPGDVNPTVLAVPQLVIERFDPGSGSTRVVGSVEKLVRGGRILVSLPDGRVLIIPTSPQLQYCGRHGIDPVTPLLFDAASNSVIAASDLPHTVQTATALRDGRVVVAGQWSAMPGGCGSNAEYVSDAWLGIYDPITGTTIESHNPITGAGTLPVDPNLPYSAAALLPDGRVALIAEDQVNGTPDALELLTVAPR